MVKINKFIFWTPRILAILFILFLALFSLDVFDGNYGFWGTILGLFISVVAREKRCFWPPESF